VGPDLRIEEGEVMKARINGYKAAAKIDAQIGEDLHYNDPLWSRVAILELNEAMKYVRTIRTTVDLLEQSLTAAIVKRLE